jgi:simple sugar transport system substrate-binding protein
MFKRLKLLAAAAVLAVAVPAVAHAQAKTFYWISHGGPADPVWTYFLQGAETWAKSTGHEVNTSFHNGDVPSQQEALRAAMAAGADGIVTTSPDPGSLTELVQEARAAKIPLINFNTSDPAAGFDAYVGTDLVSVGRGWAQYLVDNGHVKQGDFVWMPVEVPGASYGVEEEKGIREVFEPLGITWEVTETTLDQAEVITRMSDYLNANREKIKAIIGLGDLATGSIKRVFDQVGVKPGEIPVVGLGQLPRHDLGSAGGLRQRRHVAGPAGRPSYLALTLAPDGDRRHSRRSSTSSPARCYEKDTGAGLCRRDGGAVSRPEQRAPRPAAGFHFALIGRSYGVPRRRRPERFACFSGGSSSPNSARSCCLWPSW